VELKVYTNYPRLLRIKNEIIKSDGKEEVVKVALKFLPHNKLGKEEFKLFILKNEEPFMIVYLNIHYIL
jgi:hypothetical protein